MDGGVGACGWAPPRRELPQPDRCGTPARGDRGPMPARRSGPAQGTWRGRATGAARAHLSTVPTRAQRAVSPTCRRHPGRDAVSIRRPVDNPRGCLVRSNSVAMNPPRALVPGSSPRASNRRARPPEPPPASGRRGPRWVRGAVLAFVALAVLGADLPEIHAHDADTAGLYNEECPLGRLALRSWGLAAPTRDILPQPDPAADPATPRASVEPSSPPRAAFAARAPPATS